jgi:hypothetical protein
MLLQAKENLEELIVKMLAEKPNLLASDIHKEIIKTNKRYSLQAVYKELRKLHRGGVIVKTGQKYNLRLPWAIEFVSLADSISHAYLDSPSMASILPDIHKKEIWHFNNLLKMNDFWGHLLLILVQQSKKKILLGWNHHLWFHLAQTKQEEQYIKSLGLADGKLYLIVGSDSYLDKWAEKFLNKKVVQYFFGKSNFEKDYSKYINVIDDYLLIIKLDKKMTRMIEGLYQKTKSAEDIDFSTVFDIFNRKTNVSIWLEKNPKKTDIVRRRFKRFFGVDF